MKLRKNYWQPSWQPYRVGMVKKIVRTIEPNAEKKWIHYSLQYPMISW